ncbi:hypothetical protein DFH09DRAFT_1082309 [Mycena vulgaris]|nr:hypothetical protein DFH09DRAFT_1082309 [Mycena vulgaris]
MYASPLSGESLYPATFGSKPVESTPANIPRAVKPWGVQNVIVWNVDFRLCALARFAPRVVRLVRRVWRSSGAGVASTNAALGSQRGAAQHESPWEQSQYVNGIAEFGGGVESCHAGAAPWLGTGESDRGLSDWTAGWLGRFMPTRAREEWNGSGKEGTVLAPSLHAPSEGSVAKLMNEYAINECGDALVRLFRVARCGWLWVQGPALEPLPIASSSQPSQATIHGRDNDHFGKEVSRLVSSNVHRFTNQAEGRAE